MPFGLPARDEANWDTKLNDSINAVKATADAAQPAATLDASVTAVDANGASALRVQQDARQAAPKWAAGQTVAVGTTRQAPDGSWIKSTAARTTSASFTTTPLATPVLAAPTTGTTGGTLAAGTYFYKITATNALGETVGSNEVSQATTGTTSTVELTWAAIAGATGYRIYRATATGGQSTSPALVASVGAVTVYTDTGTAVTAGAVPAADTTTEQAFWTTVLGTSGTMEQAALSATYVPLTRAATDTQQGIVELATGAEATTGTDTARAVTPAGVKAVADTLVARAGRSPVGVDGAQLDLTTAKLGGYGLFLTTENRPKVVAATDFVLLHSHNVNNNNVPSQWGYNPVIVKDTTSTTAVGGVSQVYGIEVSVSNNTTESAAPQANGQVIGLFLSYIHTANHASAAVSIGGLRAGWKHGVWIDGIKSDGIAIKLVDDVAQVGGAANAGMSIGLDTSQVSGFTTAAIFLGNAHKVRTLTAAAALRDLIHMNNVDELVIGDSANNTPVRIYASALKLNTPTSATATAGTNGAPPAQVQGYFIASSPFGDVKIPYYAM